jgi:MFS family permease
MLRDAGIPLKGLLFAMRLPTPSAQSAREDISGSAEPEITARKLRIAAVCLVGQLLTGNLLISGSLALLMLPMTREFGWTRTEFAYSITALMWFGAVTMPLLGRFADRFGVRPVMLGGTFIMALVTLGLAYQTANLWGFWLAFAVVGIFSSSVVIYNSKVFGALFHRQRGKALAILGLTFPLGMAVAPQFANVLLKHFGWRGVFTGNGVLMLAVLPLLYFGLEEPGRAPATHDPKPAGEQSLPSQMEGLTAAEARRSKTLWLLIAASVISGAPTMGWLPHLLAFAVGRGFSQGVAVNTLSIAALGSAVVPLLSGYLVDRVSTARIFVPFALASAAGYCFQMVCSAQFGGLPMLMIGAALASVSLTAQSALNSYFYTRFFGLKAFAETYGIHMGLVNMSSGLAPPLIGMLFDRTGSYSATLVLAMIGQVLAAGVFMILGPYRYAASRDVRGHQVEHQRSAHA